MTLIDDEQYEAVMMEKVRPYLVRREREYWFERNEEEGIHCLGYHKNHDAKGIILISHGFTESAGKYEEVIYYFLKAGYHVYIPEHCGHGHSYRLVEDMSKVHVDDYKRYVQDFLYVAHRVRRIEGSALPMILFAHSMGGAIGLLAAAKQPELFSKIILSSPMIQPLTGSVPWTAAILIARKCQELGMEKSYVMGMHGYCGPGRFSDSCSTSFERFDYYEKQRAENIYWQTTAPTYGWLSEADRMSRLLLQHAYKHIEVPVILFQAECDKLVSLPAQEKFMKLLKKSGNKDAMIFEIQDAKHEIYNSKAEQQKDYWRKIFGFLNDWA